VFGFRFLPLPEILLGELFLFGDDA